MNTWLCSARRSILGEFLAAGTKHFSRPTIPLLSSYPVFYSTPCVPSTILVSRLITLVSVSTVGSSLRSVSGYNPWLGQAGGRIKNSAVIPLQAGGRERAGWGARARGSL